MKSKFTHEQKQAILDRYISKSESPTSIIKSVGMSGKRAKTGHFSYRKQNSIAETRSTMESFL